MNNILGFALPTNNPEIIKKILLPSLANSSELREICTWGLLFNPPYTLGEINDVVNQFRSFGFKVEYDYKELNRTDFSKGLVPISYLRNEAARLIPNCKIYSLIDDDMSFEEANESVFKSGGEQYIDAVRYMLEFYDKCGLILFRNRRKVIPAHTVRPVDITEPYYTGRGMFLRRVPNCLITPTDSEWVLGGDEENIAAGARLIKGLYPAEVHSTRVNHHEHRRSIKPAGQDIYGWYKWDVIKNNATKYIKENYNYEFKGSQAIRGSGYRDDPNIVRYEDYIKSGGLSKDKYNEYTRSYSDISVDDNLLFIKTWYERSLLDDSSCN